MNYVLSIQGLFVWGILPYGERWWVCLACTLQWCLDGLFMTSVLLSRMFVWDTVLLFDDFILLLLYDALHNKT
jgi:hypothetical protein